MGLAAEDLLRELQGQFDAKFGINLGYGSIKQTGKNNWVVSLNSRDGKISVEGTGDTDIAAVEDAFAKAEKQLSGQAASVKQKSTGQKRGLSDDFDDSFTKDKRPSSKQSTSPERQEAQAGGDVINIGEIIPGATAKGTGARVIASGDKITSAAPASISPEQQPTEPEPESQPPPSLEDTGEPAIDTVAGGDVNIHITPSVQIDGLADFDLSDDVNEIFQTAGSSILKNEGIGASEGVLTTSVLFFAFYDLGMQPDSESWLGAILPELIIFANPKLTRDDFRSFRQNYFSQIFPTERAPQRQQTPNVSQTVQQTDMSEKVNIDIGDVSGELNLDVGDVSRSTKIDVGDVSGQLNIVGRSPFSVTMTPNVYGVLQYARDVAYQTTQKSLIEVRHLMAGLLGYGIRDGSTGVHSRLEELDIDLTTVNQLVLEMIAREYPEDNLAVWRVALLSGHLFESRAQLPQYSADDAQGETDLLAIDKDVNALASLISTHYTTPPLAIGIFGDWGSGKTFFMRRLQRRISYLSRWARNQHKESQPHEIAYFGNVVQIEFNAWHYVEGNLWASLVEHIFSNLRVFEDDSSNLVERRRNELLEQLKAKELFRDQAIAKKEQAEKAREEAQKEIDRIKEEQDARLKQVARQFTIKEALQGVQLSDDAKTQLKQLAEDTNFIEAQAAAFDFYQAIQEARSVLSQGSSFVVPLVRAKDSRKRFLILLAIIILSPFVALLFGWLIYWALSLINPDISRQLATIFGWITTLLAAGTAWLRQQSTWVSKQLQAVEKANQALERQIEEERDKFAQEISAAELELNRLEAAYQVALEAQEAAERRVREIEAQLTASPAEQLARFIQERTQADDYRKHLGLLALIRRDFETLSNYINNLNAELLRPKENVTNGAQELSDNGQEGETKEAPELPDDGQEDETNGIREHPDEGQDGEDIGINRIVLYIDDLDRCPPEKVVQVLQAVHLLLAFPLFVVVVGVDSRWISYALMEKYKGLLHGEGRSVSGGMDGGREATPHDYLEKIFQIPLWLQPVDDQGARNMLAGLVTNVVADTEEEPIDHAIAEEEVEEDSLKPTEAEPITPQEPTQPPAQQETPVSQIETDTDTDTGQAEQALEEEGTADTSGPAEPELNPTGLEIRQSELNFMQDLSPILGRSPRSIKRFINVYRLIKVGLDDVEQTLFLDSREGDVSDSQIVMLLLAILTGMPAASEKFFVTINTEYDSSTSGDPGRMLGDVIESILQAEDDSSFTHADLERLDTWLSSYQDGVLQSISVDQLHIWATRVARYSFRIEQS